MPDMKTTQNGFTLIELMMVIAILGVLLAIALPSYQYYTIRARMAEGIQAMTPAKQAISEYRMSQGVFPSSNTVAGLGNVDTQYVDSVTIIDGVLATPILIAELDESETQAPGDIDIVLVPSYSGNSVVWQCGYLGAQSAYAHYLPSSCRQQLD